MKSSNLEIDVTNKIISYFHAGDDKDHIKKYNYRQLRYCTN